MNEIGAVYSAAIHEAEHPRCARADATGGGCAQLRVDVSFNRRVICKIILKAAVANQAVATVYRSNGGQAWSTITDVSSGTN